MGPSPAELDRWSYRSYAYGFGEVSSVRCWWSSLSRFYERRIGRLVADSGGSPFFPKGADGKDGGAAKVGDAGNHADRPLSDLLTAGTQHEADLSSSRLAQ